MQLQELLDGMRLTEAEARAVREALAEIDRLRAQSAELAAQNERIKHDWRMCAKCNFVWCDPKERMLDCPRCEWELELAGLRALLSEGAETSRELREVRALNAELVAALDALSFACHLIPFPEREHWLGTELMAARAALARAGFAARATEA